MVDYNRTSFKFQYYDNKEIEIVEMEDRIILNNKEVKNLIKKFHFYFKNIDDLFNLLKSNKKLFKELKEMFAREWI